MTAPRSKPIEVSAPPFKDSATWPYVLAFACRMEQKLERNRHKGDRDGWVDDEPEALLKRLRQETKELADALARKGAAMFNARSVSDVPFGGHGPTAEEIAEEAADVANFAMMIADVCDGLDPRACAGLSVTDERIAELVDLLRRGVQHDDCHPSEGRHSEWCLDRRRLYAKLGINSATAVDASPEKPAPKGAHDVLDWLRAKAASFHAEAQSLLDDGNNDMGSVFSAKALGADTLVKEWREEVLLSAPASPSKSALEEGDEGTCSECLQPPEMAILESGDSICANCAMDRAQRRMAVLETTITEAKSSTADGGVSPSAVALRREIWAQAIVQGSGVDGETHRREVARQVERIEELERALKGSIEAIRANLVHANRKDEQVLFAALTAAENVVTVPWCKGTHCHRLAGDGRWAHSNRSAATCAVNRGEPYDGARDVLVTEFAATPEPAPSRPISTGEAVARVPFRPDDGFPICDGYMVGSDDGKSTLYPTPDAARAARAPNMTTTPEFRARVHGFDSASPAGQAISANLSAPEPAPKPQTGAAIWDLVIGDMRERDAMGARKYGTRLRAGDGRDHLIDAYQEALDLAVYIRQEIEERRLMGRGRAPIEARRVNDPLPPADFNETVTKQIQETAWDENATKVKP